MKGAANISVNNLSLARRYSVVQVTIRKKLKNRSYQIRVTAIVAQGNLATESGQTVENTPMFDISELPELKSGCEEKSIPEWVSEISPVAGKMRWYGRKSAEKERWNSNGGVVNVGEVWVSWRDKDDRYDVTSLGSLCDTVSGNLAPSV
jgi:hypothetical protein